MVPCQGQGAGALIMGNNFNLDIKCGLPGRRTAMPLLFMLLLCVPAVADNVGTTKVNTYYPLSYGSFPQPIVSQKFEMKILALRTNNACVQATLAVSSAGGFNNINVTGGVFALGGNSIELAPSGSGGRVNVGSAYIDNMLMWINSNSVGAYSTNTSVTGPGGPYWTPICNGVSLGQGGVCDYTTPGRPYRLYMRADVLFGKILDGTSLRLYTDSAMTKPSNGIVP